MRTALLEVKPTTPTEEVFAEIERIAHGFGLAVNEVLDAWLDLHEYDGTTPILAELESGLRVEMTDDANEDIDTLVLQVVGESLASVDYSTMNEFMQVIEAVYRRIPLEVFHITTEGMHEIVARHLLGSILIEKAHDKQLEVLSEIFPHLSFQPEEVAASMRAARTASVVLLGKDTEEGLLRLDRIREGIEAMRDLTCILVREQPEVFAENLSTKVLAYCTLARFIIVENSEPSGHLYEIGLLANTGVVVVVLEERGSRATQMVDGTITNNRRFRRFAYTERTLPNVLATARAWAEKQIGEPDPPWKRDK